MYMNRRAVAEGIELWAFRSRDECLTTKQLRERNPKVYPVVAMIDVTMSNFALSCIIMDPTKKLLFL